MSRPDSIPIDARIISTAGLIFQVHGLTQLTHLIHMLFRVPFCLDSDCFPRLVLAPVILFFRISSPRLKTLQQSQSVLGHLITALDVIAGNPR